MNIDEIKKITVLGMGIMGPDISLKFAMGGYEVTGVDIQQAILDQATKKIASNCQQMVEGGLLRKGDVAAIQSRISLTLDWDKSVASADYITEALPERAEMKKEILKRCDQVCPKEVVVASNTSSMSITEIASEMKYPQRAIGTHWFIPAHLIPAVEVIPGEKTAAGVRELVFTLLKKVGKKPVLCKENPGFIHNYVQVAMVQAALALVEQGVCTFEDVDTVIENGFALRLAKTGPIKFMDMSGLDTALDVLRYMYEKTGHPIYRPSKLLEEKVKRGELGLKTKKGFYKYSDDELEMVKARTNFAIMKVIKALEGV